MQAVPLSVMSGIHIIASRKKVSAAKLGPQSAPTSSHISHLVGHFTRQTLCPLYPRKRTLDAVFRMSAKGQKQTSSPDLIPLLSRLAQR